MESGVKEYGTMGCDRQEQLGETDNLDLESRNWARPHKQQLCRGAG